MRRKVHRERHKQDNHKQCQQCRANADPDFAVHDLLENPHTQPNETNQECKATDCKNGIHLISPNSTYEYYRNQFIFYKIIRAAKQLDRRDQRKINVGDWRAIPSKSMLSAQKD
jgi:hypothetical protein